MSLMSKGMCCSASQWICSSSSFGVIIGTVIFRTMTLCPYTPIAMSRCWIFPSWKRRASASITVPEFMTWPSMIVCGGSGAKPQRTTCSFLRASLSCTTLIELAPMSTPTRFLPSAMRASRRAHAKTCELPTSVAFPEAPRQKDGLASSAEPLGGALRRLRAALVFSRSRIRYTDARAMRHAALEAARLLRTRTPFAALSLVAAVLATEPVARADVTHVVQRGHTIEAIAHRYRVSVKAILEANHLKDGNHLKPGQVLVVPGVDSPKRDKTAKADAEPAGLRAAQAALAPAPQPRGHETGDVIHLVRGGEALTIHVKDAHGRIPPAALESFERAMRQGTATHPPDPRLVALIAIVSD